MYQIINKKDFLESSVQLTNYVSKLACFAKKVKININTK